MRAAAAEQAGAEGGCVAEIVPVDQFLDWYPGWTAGLIESPWVEVDGTSGTVRVLKRAGARG